MGKPRSFAETPLGILARRRGYALSWNRSIGAWLTWRDDSERAGDVPFERVFEPARFRRPNPDAPFDQLHLFFHGLDEAGWEQDERDLEAIIARAAGNFGAAMPELNAVAQAADVQLDRIITQAAEPLAKAEAVLRVWFAETERAVLEDPDQAVLARVEASEEARYRHNATAGILGFGLDPRTSEKAARRMRKGTVARAGDGTGYLVQQARILWDYTVYGVYGNDGDAEALLSFYDSLSAPAADGGLGTPALVAEAQRQGLASAARDLDVLRAEMRAADSRRVVYERARLHALAMLSEGVPETTHRPALLADHRVFDARVREVYDAGGHTWKESYEVVVEEAGGTRWTNFKSWQDTAARRAKGDAKKSRRSADG